MACSSCLKMKEAEAYEKALKMAELEANLDKRITIVYETNGKYFGECRSCWEKNGAVGKLILTVYPV